MSWKRVLYLFLVALVAGGSGLAGAAVGGAVVYRTLQAQPTDDQLVFPDASTDPVQTLSINTTEIETTITQAVKAVGPAVVTVVGTVLGSRPSSARLPIRT
jgi:hypothetical protein